MSGPRRSLAVAIGICALIAVFIFGCQRNLLYFPDTTRLAPSQPGVQLIKLRSAPDLELTHLYHPPREPNGPVVVVFHGNGGHAGHRVTKFRDLLDAGFGVFFAEYRGYGGNPGQPDEPGLTADARAVMVYFQSEGVDPGRIVIYGESLGTGLAVKMAAAYPVAGAILEAPYTSIADVAQEHYGFLAVDWLVLDKWDVSTRIADISAPVLVVHGELDRVIPVRFGKQMYELASEPKAALFHPVARHNDLFHYPEVVQRVIAFVREHAPAAANADNPSDTVD